MGLGCAQVAQVQGGDPRPKHTTSASRCPVSVSWDTVPPGLPLPRLCSKAASGFVGEGILLPHSGGCWSPW